MAILVADVVGYSRLITEAEAWTVATLRGRHAAMAEAVAAHGGEVLKLVGDGLVAGFPSAVRAVECAVAVQDAVAAETRAATDGRAMWHRIGVNLGEVVLADGEIYGDGINVAARLEAVAPPGGVAISAKVQDEVVGRLDRAFADRGELALKNIARPVRVFEWRPAGDAAAPSAPPAQPARPAPVPAAPRPHGPGDRRGLAIVLPIVADPTDRDLAAWADAATDALRLFWQREPGLRVAGAGTAETYRGRLVDPAVVGRERPVGYVLQGTARRSGDGIAVTLSLADHEGTQLLERAFSGAREERLRAPEAVAELFVAEAIPAVMLADRDRGLFERPDAPDALDLYLRGRHVPITRSNHEEILALYDRALALWPGFALCWWQRARLLWEVAIMMRNAADPATFDLGSLGVWTSFWDSLRRARSLTSASDPLHLRVLYLEAVAYRLERRYEQAIATLDGLIARMPGDAAAHRERGLIGLYLGRPEVAVADFDRAVALTLASPRPMPQVLAQAAVARVHVGDDTTAIALARRSLDINTSADEMNERGFAFAALASAHAHLGRIDEAVRIRDECERVIGHSRLAIARLGARSHALSDSPVYRAGVDRLLEGLRLAGFP